MRTKTDESQKNKGQVQDFLFQYDFLIKDFVKWDSKEKGEPKYVESQT